MLFSRKLRPVLDLPLKLFTLYSASLQHLLYLATKPWLFSLKIDNQTPLLSTATNITYCPSRHICLHHCISWHDAVPESEILHPTDFMLCFLSRSLKDFISVVWHKLIGLAGFQNQFKNLYTNNSDPLPDSDDNSTAQIISGITCNLPQAMLWMIAPTIVNNEYKHQYDIPISYYQNCYPVTLYQQPMVACQGNVIFKTNINRHFLDDALEKILFLSMIPICFLTLQNFFVHTRDTLFLPLLKKFFYNGYRINKSFCGLEKYTILFFLKKENNPQATNEQLAKFDQLKQKFHEFYFCSINRRILEEEVKEYLNASTDSIDPQGDNRQLEQELTCIIMSSINKDYLKIELKQIFFSSKHLSH